MLDNLFDITVGIMHTGESSVQKFITRIESPPNRQIQLPPYFHFFTLLSLFSHSSIELLFPTVLIHVGQSDIAIERGGGHGWL